MLKSWAILSNSLGMTIVPMLIVSVSALAHAETVKLKKQ